MNIPINVSHEQSVIAGMMNNDSCYYDALALTESEYYADENTQRIFNELAKSEKRLSAAMLMKKTDDPRLKSAIRTFDSHWVSREEFDDSLDGLKDTYLKRQLYYTMNKVAKRFDESKADDLIATIQNEIGGYLLNDTGENMIFPEERAAQALQELWDRLDDPESAKGLPYSWTNEKGRVEGFPSLDKAFHGAHGGDLIMLAAKTGEGKTAFAVNLARHFSFKQDYWGYYMNTEMRIEEMEARLLAPIAGVETNEILHGILTGTKTERQVKRDMFNFAYDQYKKSKLVMSRIPDLPLHKAKGLAKQLKAKVPELQYLIVDYVGRMDVKDFNGSAWDELYEITKQLKELAITLDIPVFILAQRNQAGEVEGAKKMMNECDGVLFFEPITEEDQKDIDARMNAVHAEIVNYKIVKKKVRRDDNPYPVYVLFDKKRSFITEVGR